MYRDDMDDMVKSTSDENQSLASRTRKGRIFSLGRRCSSRRRDSPGRKDSPEREEYPRLRQKNDLSNIICYKFHDFGHYASQCPHRRGRGRRK
jgi:hypothetical protein